MNRFTIYLFLALLLLSACSPLPPTPDPTSDFTPSPVPSAPTPLSGAMETAVPEATLPPTEEAAPDPTPDFSAISLYETTHLMDPNFFQVSIASWPGDLPEGVILHVSGMEYSCEVLFPDDFPGRLYCWGPAPVQGTRAMVEIFLPGESEPAYRLDFIVPRP